MDTVHLKFHPTGEIREFAADAMDEVTRLMAQGWHQHHLVPGEPAEFLGAAPLEPAKPGNVVEIGMSEAKEEGK